MGILDDIKKNPQKVVLGKARSTMDKLVKEKRLVFVEKSEEVLYTDKMGNRNRITLEAMAQIFMDRVGGASFGGYDGNITGVITQDFVSLLKEVRQNKKGDSNANTHD